MDRSHNNLISDGGGGIHNRSSGKFKREISISQRDPERS